jgi:hypothetical protein
MYHILNNYVTFQHGGLSKQLGQRMYISAFIYILLLFVYSLETAAYLKGKDILAKLKSKGEFFAIFITFSVLIPIIMLLLVFAVVVKKKAESYVNFAIWALMGLHLGLTLAAFIIAEPSVAEDIKGFAYTRLIFIFLSMGLALQGGKVHNKIKYGTIGSGESKE